MTMFGTYILPRSISRKSLFSVNKCNKLLISNFSTRFGVKNLDKKRILYAGVPISLFGGYYLYQTFQYKPASLPYAKSKNNTLLLNKPDIPVSRKIKGVFKDPILSITLFQYPTCPFCCKVRAFLDYYGLSYDVIEVDPVLRQQTSWTTYKKVPIVLVKVENGYQQLNDSTMIISALRSYLMNEGESLDKIVNFYHVTEFQDSDGKINFNINNKYFLMYGDKLDYNKDSILEELMWRQWADNSLVHVLSPNVYRTFDESLQAFKWFSEVGEWDKLFPSWEKFIIVYVGAVAMYFIGKRLKKRHQLKSDVRESLYDECRRWMKALSQKKTIFMGGDSPNLADLAVYGVLSSIEGCLAFNDLLEKTTIKNWYHPMKEAVKNHEGQKYLSVKALANA